MRGLYLDGLDLNPPRLGGLDPVTMEPIVVEVDETKYFHRKYARGQWHEGHWVFGGIERGNPHNAFLQEVPDRRAATLNPILQQFVAEGSMVNTDLWATYNGIVRFRSTQMAQTLRMKLHQSTAIWPMLTSASSAA